MLISKCKNRFNSDLILAAIIIIITVGLSSSSTAETTIMTAMNPSPPS
ncbi:hypothetical protein BFJ68_g17583 [Fusarium oxysporum]|uniref:Uncharacterized protein n=1 Tax=Fusarium oxysporum TaxID=5507 RepID=A0A420NNW8_FUSOX|nr:hypothetical protein BFJ68_g17583 [Fusarium oxysporum]